MKTGIVLSKTSGLPLNDYCTTKHTSKKGISFDGSISQRFEDSLENHKLTISRFVQNIDKFYQGSIATRSAQLATDILHSLNSNTPRNIIATIRNFADHVANMTQTPSVIELAKKTSELSTLVTNSASSTTESAFMSNTIFELSEFFRDKQNDEKDVEIVNVLTSAIAGVSCSVSSGVKCLIKNVIKVHSLRKETIKNLVEIDDKLRFRHTQIEEIEQHALNLKLVVESVGKDTYDMKDVLNRYKLLSDAISVVDFYTYAPSWSKYVAFAESWDAADSDDTRKLYASNFCLIVKYMLRHARERRNQIQARVMKLCADMAGGTSISVNQFDKLVQQLKVKTNSLADTTMDPAAVDCKVGPDASLNIVCMNDDGRIIKTHKKGDGEWTYHFPHDDNETLYNIYIDSELERSPFFDAETLKVQEELESKQKTAAKGAKQRWPGYPIADESLKENAITQNMKPILHIESATYKIGVTGGEDRDGEDADEDAEEEESTPERVVGIWDVTILPEKAHVQLAPLLTESPFEYDLNNQDFIVDLGNNKLSAVYDMVETDNIAIGRDGFATKQTKLTAERAKIEKDAKYNSVENQFVWQFRGLLIQNNVLNFLATFRDVQEYSHFGHKKSYKMGTCRQN